MRSLKPITTFVAGSVLLAVAVAIVAACVQPDFRSPRGMAIVLVTFLVFGMILFGSVAAGEAFRSAFVHRHFEQFERWSAFVLAMGTGHWAGTMLGHTGIIWAFAFVILGAGFRIYLSGLVKRPAA